MDETLKSYNVIWESQSTGSEESMPLGGYDTGCNVWAENNSIYMMMMLGSKAPLLQHPEKFVYSVIDMTFMQQIRYNRSNFLRRSLLCHLK